MKTCLTLLLSCSFALLIGDAYAQIKPKQKPPVQPNVVNGTNTTIDQQPWQVYLSSGCGGSIIGPTTVLTAAHCVNPNQPSSLQIYAGSSFMSDFSNNQVRTANVIRVHPSYNGSGGQGDIAVVEVNTPFVFNANVQPIRYDGGPGVAPPNTMATASGWGVTTFGGSQPNQLQRTNIPIVDNANLQQAQYSYTLTNDMIAAGGNFTGICHGDSGGPLWVTSNGQNFLVGVTSFRSNNGCANSSNPEIFTRVSSYCGWILQQVLTMTFINGPNIICSTGTYSKATSNTNLNWSTSNAGGLSIDNNGNVTRQNNYNGPMTISLTGSNACGSASASLPIWVGTMDLSKVTYDFDQYQANDLNVVSAYTTHTVYVGVQAGGVGYLTSPVSWNAYPYGIGGPYGWWQYDFILNPGQSLFFNPLTASNACGTVSRTLEFWAPYSYAAYPNPTTERFAVEFNETKKLDLLPSKLLLFSDQSTIPVQEISLSEVHSKRQFVSGKKVEFDVSKLPRGTYYLHVVPKEKTKRSVDRIRIQLQ